MYVTTVWTDEADDNRTYEIESVLEPSLRPDPMGQIRIFDHKGKTWIFNWSHVVGASVEEKAK